jgi:hypothetical protein
LRNADDFAGRSVFLRNEGRLPTIHVATTIPEVAVMTADPAARLIQWFVIGLCGLCFTLSAAALS